MGSVNRADKTIHRCCADIATHSHDGGRTLTRNGRTFTHRHTFEWRRPAFHAYRTAANRPLGFGLNRYPGIVIGAAVGIRGTSYGVVWGRPGKVVEVSR